MSDMDRYFERVVALDKDLWFSIHHSTANTAYGIPGNAHKTFAAAAQDAAYWSARGADVYMGMGAQRDAYDPRPPFPYPGAIRRMDNIVLCKALYLDLDVKEGAFASTAEAFDRLKEFIRWSTLPFPTVLVLSGTGGMHVYWTMEEQFPPSEFRLMARQLVTAARQFGLHFDPQVTPNVCALLRVPDTLNHKRNPALPVKLFYAAPKDINLETMKRELSKFGSFTPERKARREAPEGEDLSAPAPVFKKAKLDAVAVVCPWVRNTLAAEGRNLVGEPMWHEALVIACHTDNPLRSAARLCESNEFYDQEQNERKLQQALVARERNPRIGPTSCQKLSDFGVAECASCPLLHNNSNPISLSFARTNGHAYLSPVGDLPVGYYRADDDGLIYEEGKAESDTPEGPLLVFPYEIIEGSVYAEDGEPFRVTFQTREGGGRLASKTVEYNQIADRHAFAKVFGGKGMPIAPKLIQKSQEFWVNFLKVLRDQRDTLINIPALGWEKDDDGETGFAYGGEFVTPKGRSKTRKCDLRHYEVTGDDVHFRNLARIIIVPERPDLQVLTATAFGAPLVCMTGQQGFMVGAWSADSGIGKSTAQMLGQSVYARPEARGYTDTVNFTMDRCAQLKHLPLYYDEVKGRKQIMSFTEMAFQLTGGGEKGRSDRTGKAREVRTWETMLVYAANASIVEEMRLVTRGTDASLYRMFEFTALTPQSVSQQFTSDVARMGALLRDNYGGIGRIYADHLGRNHQRISDSVGNTMNILEDKLGAKQSHRFWLAAVATTLVGAKMALMLDLAPFDIGSMYRFLTKEYERMAGVAAVSTEDYSNPHAVHETLAAVMSAKAARNTIITDNVPQGTGRPSKGASKILNDKGNFDEIDVRVSLSPYEIRIRDEALSKWCEQSNRPKSAFTQGLIKFHGARLNSLIIASGTRLGGQAAKTWVVPVTGTQLQNLTEWDIQFSK